MGTIIFISYLITGLLMATICLKFTVVDYTDKEKVSIFAVLVAFWPIEFILMLIVLFEECIIGNDDEGDGMNG